LITPTIPSLQWNDGAVVAQKNQIGALTLVMIRFHTWTGAVRLRPIIYPLWNPPGIGAQGSSKLDCVTVWTFPKNSKEIVAFIAAVTVSGV